jgi:hypothetical protein
MPARTPTAIFRQPTPEEAELFRRRSQLAVRRAALAARELTLAHLRAQLNSFEGRYIRQVGVLYIQLDDWEDRIAALNSPPQIPSVPDTTDPQITPPATPPEPIQAAIDLKALFHQVAKRIHPDFARDHHDERHRTHLMAQANDAFRRDDTAILQRMLHGYDPSQDAGDTTNTAAALAQVLTQIDQSMQDIALIDAEFEALAQSEIAQLKDRTTRAALSGRDLLAELAARVKGSIGIAMRRYELDVARIRRHQPAFDPSPLLTAETARPHPTNRHPPTASRATIESDKC